MTPVRVQNAAALRIQEIYQYSRERWGETQADAYIMELFEAFDGIATGALISRPVPAELGVDGYVLRYRRHFTYWKTLNDGAIGIVTVLHERMHQFGRFLEEQEP